MKTQMPTSVRTAIIFEIALTYVGNDRVRDREIIVNTLTMVGYSPPLIAHLVAEARQRAGQ